MKRREFITIVGGVVAWPLAAQAQQQAPQRTVTVGILGAVGITDASPSFIEALDKLGYRRGQNLTILFRSPKDSNAELPGLAAELVSLKPDVLVAGTTPPVLALKEATTTVPIVMVGIGNPIATGLVKSLAHPGGSITGTANAVEEWIAKRLQSVKEMLPGIRCLSYLRNPTNQSIMVNDAQRKSIGQKLGIDFEVIDVSTAEQLDQVLTHPLPEQCKTALFLPLDGLFIARRMQIAEFALRQKAALFAAFREDAEAGALIAYGFNLDAQWRLGATYVDQILKGAKPADLPVQQPTTFETVINLKTAKAIGIQVPTSLLLGADEVIE
jgi:putative tryptophan/tyrosine transport system substrate-binding protein